MVEETFDNTINSFLNTWGIWIGLGLVAIVIIILLARRFDEIVKDIGSGIGGGLANIGSAIWNRVFKPLLQWFFKQFYLVTLFLIILILGVGYIFYDGDVLGLLKGLGIIPA